MFYNKKREFLFGRQSYFRIYVKNLPQTDNFEEKFYSFSANKKTQRISQKLNLQSNTIYNASSKYLQVFSRNIF